MFSPLHTAALNGFLALVKYLVVTVGVPVNQASICSGCLMKQILLIKKIHENKYFDENSLESIFLQVFCQDMPYINAFHFGTRR